MSIPGLRGPLKAGKMVTVFGPKDGGAPAAAGSESKTLPIDADSILVSLWVTSISGTLDVKVYTYTDTGQEIEAIVLPQATATSTDLLIRKAAAVMSNIRVEATYSDACEFDVRVRGIQAGESSVRILAANEAKASQTNIGTSATLLVPAAFTDRAGFVVKNNNTGAGENLYIGFTALEATASNGYPLGPQEAMGIDVAAGQSVYAIGSTAIDVRILEASS